jgi:6-pyruvoyltetrahydropterin/6-carboxytetrahydropterin synthase
MIRVTKKYHFYAAHRNRTAGEKCGRIHGHTYEVVCHLEFASPNAQGITCLFADIDAAIEPIIRQYDHYFLLYEKDPLAELLTLANEPFLGLPFETSAENMAMWLFYAINKETGLPIKRLELAETKSSNVIYEP